MCIYFLDLFRVPWIVVQSRRLEFSYLGSFSAYLDGHQRSLKEPTLLVIKPIFLLLKLILCWYDCYIDITCLCLYVCVCIYIVYFSVNLLTAEWFVSRSEVTVGVFIDELTTGVFIRDGEKIGVLGRFVSFCVPVLTEFYCLLKNSKRFGGKI